MKESSEPDVKRIHVTGDGQAYFKTFYGLPYCQELYNAVYGRVARHEDIAASERKALVPIFEARYKSSLSTIEMLVRQEGIRQVYEMASGMSSVGLIMTEKFPNMIYVEADLPDMIKKKEMAVKEVLIKHHSKKRDLFFCATDVRNMSQIEASLSHLRPNQNVIVYMEGLLNYFDAAGKQEILANAANILRRFGGYIVTPDFSSDRQRNKHLWSAISLTESRRQIEMKTGRSFDDNAFENQEETDKFLDKMGFIVRKYKPRDYVLESFARLKISPEIEKILREDFEKNLVVRILKLKDKP